MQWLIHDEITGDAKYWVMLYNEFGYQTKELLSPHWLHNCFSPQTSHLHPHHLHFFTSLLKIKRNSFFKTWTREMSLYSAQKRVQCLHVNFIHFLKCSKELLIIPFFIWDPTVIRLLYLQLECTWQLHPSYRLCHRKSYKLQRCIFK